MSGPTELDSESDEGILRIKRGDYSAELSNICKKQQYAAQFASNSTQAALLHQCIEYFRHGDIQA
ncbi:hypothetical protein QBC41DRAFT_325223 [Cercophora samala]|uniref:Uncharacterized protein n=1 Tax=Cercophora samala TaxID=330535 RepID=A0AA40DAH5_9PEZI|nr:hypothetical protein QBC41DRAFT_325223 [Cercophora samala]